MHNSEKRIDLSDLAGEYTLDEMPKVLETINGRIAEAKKDCTCEHCGALKKNKNGLCISCGKFPVWTKLKDKESTQKPKSYFIDYNEWLKSFYCMECGSIGQTNFSYITRYANGEEWRCLKCGSEISVDEEPNQDDY